MEGEKHVKMDLRWIRCHGVPGWGISSDGREVSIVQRHRLLEMDVINEVIMGSAWNME